MEELFVNGALYGFRIMYMLMLIDVLVCFRKGKLAKKDVVLYGASLIGFFLCGISSGIFELGCCIFPLLLYEIWDVLERNNEFKIRYFFDGRLLIVCGAIAVSLCGIIANKLLGFDGSSAMHKTTMPADGLGQNIIQVFVSLFQLFGWPLNNVDIASLSGIFAFAAVAATLAVLFVFVVSTIYSFQKYGISGERRVYCRQVLCIFLVNALLFCFADLTYGLDTFEYRYWLTAMIPLFLEFGILYDYSNGHIKASYRKFLFTCYVMLLVCISVYKDYGMWHVDCGGSKFDGLMGIAKEQERDTIFIYSDYFSGRVFLAFAPEELEVFAVDNSGVDDEGKAQFRMPKWGNYVKYDGDCMELAEDKKIGMFVTDSVGEDYQKLLAKAEEVVPIEDGFSFLVMNENYMDFEYGVPKEENDHSRDYLNWGYDRMELALDEAGDYVSSGEQACVLSGEFISDRDGKYSATIEYEVLSCQDEERPAVFDIVVTGEDGKEKSYDIVLDVKETSATIEDFALRTGDTYRVTVEESEGTVLTLKQIEYYTHGR